MHLAAGTGVGAEGRGVGITVVLSREVEEVASTGCLDSEESVPRMPRRRLRGYSSSSLGLCAGLNPFGPWINNDADVQEIRIIDRCAICI